MKENVTFAFPIKGFMHSKHILKFSVIHKRSALENSTNCTQEMSAGAGEESQKVSKSKTAKLTTMYTAFTFY